ncbi:Outer-membrane lipoprotein carrier protein [Rubrivivax sp. A210]|uniref:LolA-related protein n=1 Tax=Rubrivivax sp. A210 TaxID=2772301 RepID=UPI00191AD9F9|nr:LolA-related protein [Rubrivivax sp. A210]CAD5372048.1 Outer-membrane lipoprotein carrier protein [Rubrivivax sp. A210]
MRTHSPDRRGFVAGLLLAAALPARALDLPELAALLARRKSGEARFTEERTVGGLDGPLLSSGTLSFTAPSRFARHTLQPREESMVVDGNSLVLKRGGRSRQMALDAIPELGALVEALRGTLSGDAATLARHFQVQVEGAPARWTLTLKPRDARLATQLREIKITGLASDVRSVELWMSGGDRSVMAIEPLPAAAR